MADLISRAKIAIIGQKSAELASALGISCRFSSVLSMPCNSAIFFVLLLSNLGVRFRDLLFASMNLCDFVCFLLFETTQFYYYNYWV